MGTKFEEVYARFLNKVNDYDFLEFDPTTQYELLGGLLISSISDFEICKQDLEDRDDVVQCFNINLTSKEKEILAIGMLVHWLEPKVFSTETLRNVLNTKDYSAFSPAKLLEQEQLLLHSTQQIQRNLITLYSYRNGDVATLAE